jgi:hypothetical protein
MIFKDIDIFGKDGRGRKKPKSIFSLESMKNDSLCYFHISSFSLSPTLLQTDSLFLSLPPSLFICRFVYLPLSLSYPSNFLLSGKKSREESEKAEIEESALIKMTKELEAGRAARTAQLSNDEHAAVKSLGLLTYKPMIYCANVAEGDLADQGSKNKHVQVGCLKWIFSSNMGGMLFELLHIINAGARILDWFLESSFVYFMQVLRKRALEDGCEVVVVSAKVRCTACLQEIV